jgi:hypothetical protein
MRWPDGRTDAPDRQTIGNVALFHHRRSGGAWLMEGMADDRLLISGAGGLVRGHFVLASQDNTLGEFIYGYIKSLS